MEKINITFVVAGDEGSGKEQFKKQFLDYYKDIAEVHRKKDILYVIHISKEKKKNITIWLHVVKETTTVLERNFEMHGIFFCYSPNRLNSLINLEKNWIEPLASKASHCFLVPKKRGLKAQDDSLDQQNKAKKLEERYQLQSSIEYNNMKTFFDHIMNTFLDASFLQNLSGRRQSIEDPSLGEESIDGQCSRNSSPSSFRVRPPRRPYVKLGRRRSIF